jgi:hypothetical protein
VPERIEDLLQRRSDLSTFLVHLTRDSADRTARDNLLAILLERELKAISPMGMAVDVAKDDPAFAETQKVVCFTETPLEHVWMLCEDIENRTVQLRPYGLAFTKTWARRHRANPIWYIDITPSGHEWLTNPINEMLKAAAAGQAVVSSWPPNTWAKTDLAHAPIARLTPFFEQMGKPAEIRKEFWWEREWRRVGDVGFQWHEAVAVFVPENDHVAFSQLLEAGRTIRSLPALPRPWRFLDPAWGLERMIAALADVPAADVGPFPG